MPESINVPFLDIKAQNAQIADRSVDAIQEIISHSQFALGPSVESFENAFAAFCDAKHCVGLNNGTTALHLALLANDIGPGDEVITTPHSWISTSWAISYVGATPVYVDIDPYTYNIDLEHVASRITDRTKAILPVHLYGNPVDMFALSEIARKHNLVLIEDAAQAHGARRGGQSVGSLGDCSCFSFYPGKNLGAFGEGGAVTTNSAECADRIRRLRDHAQDGRHNHIEIGFNARMESIQAAVLDIKLAHLPQWNRQRSEHAQFYLSELEGLDGLKLPVVAEDASHAWHLFVVLVENRDAFRESLAKRGVATGVHYPTPIPYQPAYAHLNHKPGDFPVAEDVMSHCVSLPMYPDLTKRQREHVVESIRAVLSETPVS